MTTAPLPYREMPFSSVEIDADSLSVDDSSEFSTRLFITVQKLRAEKKNAVYLKVSMLYAHYIPMAGLFGFQYHHAEGDVAMLLLWLPQDIECKVPPFATHLCGVAGLIVNDDQELLVVKEKTKLVGWKLPGGYVNLNEEWGTAAEREVREETGIKSQFQSVLAVRHSLNNMWSRGDVYVICRLKALSKDIVVDEEIEDARWMPVKEFEAQATHPMMLFVCKLLNKHATGFTENTMKSVLPGRPTFKLYAPSVTFSSVL